MLSFGSRTAFAELQQVDVGGALELYAHYYGKFYETADETRIPAPALFGRPIGSNARDEDTNALISFVRSFDSGTGASGLAWVEQRTSLHLRAQFTEDVSAFVEFDSIGDWGEAFRSNYVSGADAPGGGDVSLYQAYIEAEAFPGLPLRLRLGRQELVLGNQWLVGNNYWPNPLTYLSFDGARLTYASDTATLEAFWMKPAERFLDFGDTDIDFYGLYGAYTGLENWEFNAYWLYIHDGQDIADTPGGGVLDLIERFRGLDDYGSTDIHTVGLRAYAALGNWEVEAEAAYQWGNAAAAGTTFAPSGYGDGQARYGNWAGQFNVGYTFGAAWEPYVYLGAEYYGGEDHRDRSLFQYLNPFYRPQASISFNRLFSSWEADWFLDGSALSNLWIGKAGLSATPSEKLEIGLDFLYLEALDAFDTPVWRRYGPNRTPLTFLFPFQTRKGSKDLGIQAIFWAEYAYSDDLSFEGGWAHLFTGEGLKDGNFVDSNGLGFLGGLGDDDADYVWLGAKLVF